MTAAYLAHEAGRLAGVDGDRVGQWARWGHIRASVSAADPHVYAFEDVADALAVRLLLDTGIPLPLIRRAVERLGGDHPLAHGLHVVDGRMAVERAGGLEEIFTEQRVFGGLDWRLATGGADGAGSRRRSGFASSGRLDPVALLRAGGWPAIVTGTTRIEVDPARLGGRPCLRGRRVPVEDAVDGGLDLTDEEIAEARVWCDV